jgi:hypothetical protein
MITKKIISFSFDKEELDPWLKDVNSRKEMVLVLYGQVSLQGGNFLMVSLDTIRMKLLDIFGISNNVSLNEKIISHLEKWGKIEFSIEEL